MAELLVSVLAARYIITVGPVNEWMRSATVTEPHHHHSANGADTLIRHAEDVCAARGTVLTPLRRRVFAELVHAGTPLGAYDIVERLGRERRMAPISVYRVLDFLIDAGLIHRIAARNTYLPCHHSHDSDDATVFLVCTRCGSVDEVSSPDVSRGLDGTAAAAGFRPGVRSVELEGECANCQTASAA